MVLSDRDIKTKLREKVIVLNPEPLPDQISSFSIDLHLSHEFYVFEYSKMPFLDPMNKHTEMPVRKISVQQNERFILQPGAFVIGSTVEHMELPDDIVGRLEGRSSLGRLGIVIHSTAPHFDPGFRGQLTLELGNIGSMPVALYPNMRICAISFEQLSSPAEVPYYKKRVLSILINRAQLLAKLPMTLHKQ
ncbi:MAG: Deoxycytidine triphosphate deaminase [Microgenomates bacterium OLB23]|nr:MAG: Deoxycytidine triphosphate deaminase [Microgenomates bacterium OLB23]